VRSLGSVVRQVRWEQAKNQLHDETRNQAISRICIAAADAGDLPTASKCILDNYSFHCRPSVLATFDYLVERRTNAIKELEYRGLAVSDDSGIFSIVQRQDGQVYAALIRAYLSKMPLSSETASPRYSL
jgi:hypothetical protein